MIATLIFVGSLVLALVLQVIELPPAVAAGWPIWPLLVIGYWALYVPAAPVLVAAWITGLACDVLLDAPLGQHALGQLLVAFTVRRLSGIYILFPRWQATLALAPVWALYVFLMFWIDGLSRHAASTGLRWLPILPTIVVWPLYAGLLDFIRAQHGRARNRMRLP